MNKYYCTLPFHSIENEFSFPDKNIFCCRLKSNTDINNVRLSISNKERSPDCTSCWQLEDQGLRSERQTHNETLDFLLDMSLENIESNSLKNGFNPLVIKLATSNLCNGQCVTCNSNCSSSWASLENKNTQYKGIDLKILDTNLDWTKIVSLSFVGGEPLLEKKNFKILEKLIESKNTNCFISIVTNGSIGLNQTQITILEQFNNLNICLSVDGTNLSFEYMRYPFKWDKFLTNLKLFKNLTDNLSVSCMISNLNVYYYSDLITFFKDNNLNYLCKQINYPKIFMPGNLSDSAKEVVRKNNKKYVSDVESFLQIGTYTEDLFFKLKNEITRQDDLKGIDIKNYMPEVANLL